MSGLRSREWSSMLRRGPGMDHLRGVLMADLDQSKLLLVIIAILLPPLAVGLKEGVGGHLILNIILCVLFWLPGLLHALYIVLR